VILANRISRQTASLLSNLNLEAAAVLERHVRIRLFFIARLAIFLTMQRPLANSIRIAKQRAGGGLKIAETHEYAGKRRHGRRPIKSNHPSTL